VQETNREEIGLWMSGMFPGGPVKQADPATTKEQECHVC